MHPKIKEFGNPKKKLLILSGAKLNGMGLRKFIYNGLLKSGKVEQELVTS